MRKAAVLLGTAMLLVACISACISAPEFLTADDAADAAGGGSAPVTVADPDASDPGTTPEVDASPTTDEDANVEPPGPNPPEPPPPPTNTCNTTGAPAGAQCCGAGNTPPLCVGMACAHCGDCVAKACSGQSVCCAISPGKSGNYKGMSCALNGLAGLCP